MEHDFSKNIVFIAPDFRLTHISILERLLDDLVDILGADKKRMLYLVDREYEALDQNTWEGWDWNFPAYLDRPDVMLYFKPEGGLVLTIFEPVNIFDEDEDEDWFDRFVVVPETRSKDFQFVKNKIDICCFWRHRSFMIDMKRPKIN